MRGRRAILLALAVVAGCSDDGVEPQPPDSRSRVTGVPLAVGATWSYDLAFDISWTLPDGSEFRAPEHREGSGVREITSEEEITNRMYVVETFTAMPDGGSPSTRYTRLRQDAAALYRADLSASIVPGGVPEDAVVGDLVLLQFPLTQGDSWQRNPAGGGDVYTVEGIDELDLPGGKTDAWRIRLDIATAGPDDTIRLWYTSDGLVRRAEHVEFTAVDVGTGMMVHIVTHEVQVLVDFEPGDSQ